MSTNPPEYQPELTDTQRLAHDITTATTNIRRDWPHMIRPGETQAPGWAKKTGATLGGKGGTIDDHGRLRYPEDQSPDLPSRRDPDDPDWTPPTSDTDQRRIDKVVSFRAYVAKALAEHARVVVDDRKVKNHVPLATDVPGMCIFLERHADWLSGHDIAEGCRDELRDIAHRTHLIAYPAKRDSMSLGRCPLEIPGEQDVLETCGGDVRARTGDEHHIDGKVWGACSRCGEVSPADWWAERMFVDGEGSPLVTIGELVGVIAYRLGVTVTHEQVRQWKARGKIEDAGRDHKGRVLFRHEQVIDSIRSHVRRRAAT